MDRLTTTGMKDTRDWRALKDRPVATLKAVTPPLPISFHGHGETPRAARVDVRYPPPSEHGRTRQVPSDCVFRVHGATDTFATVAPLAEHPTLRDLVLLRINGLGLMTLKNAFPEMPIEGKPQGHIVAMAKDQNVEAASVGCALSRSCTGMRSEELTCAIAGRRLPEVVEMLEVTVGPECAVASYASADAKRFG